MTILFFVCFVFVVIALFVDASFQVCGVGVIALVSFSLFVCLFVCLFFVIEENAVFISMQVGAGRNYNYLLVRNLTFLIL